MASYKNTPLGSIIINVPSEKFPIIDKYLNHNNVVWKHY